MRRAGARFRSAPMCAPAVSNAAAERNGPQPVLQRCVARVAPLAPVIEAALSAGLLGALRSPLLLGNPL